MAQPNTGTRLIILLRRGSLNSSLPPRPNRIRAGMPASKRAQQSRHSAQATPVVGATAPYTSAATNPTPISITARARAESHINLSTVFANGPHYACI
ncbi:hypothetical protein C8R44DRAFT_881284 [Mycena epipterygia]|nr:hypothetical protein C8R44DRAFT_881276 [Mycena epipterygia]KAJ7114446.1 hypothetical protein C8R44DRAFT_881284 [Mycena epipterygia]